MRKMKPASETPTNRALVTEHRPFLFVTLLLVALAITACGRRPVPPEVEMTPASGSVEAPAEDADTSGESTSDAEADDASADDAGGADAAAATDSDEGTDAAEADVDAAAESAIAPGAQAIVLAEAGARVHADAATDAQVLHLYNAGEALDVLAPSGDYDSYPVTGDDGQAWVRVRAGDGLVGWVLMASIGAAD